MPRRIAPVFATCAFLMACAEGTPLDEIPDSNGASTSGPILTTSASSSSDSTGSTTGVPTSGPGSGTDSGSDTDSGTDPTGVDTGDNGNCGNGVIEGSEECDGGDLGGHTCTEQGFGGGGLLCTVDCTLDTSKCSACGNDIVDPGEECDGRDLGDAATCLDVGLGQDDEPLGCTTNCTYDFAGCSGCGDAVVVDPEDCEPPAMPQDPPDLAGSSCQSLGYDGGALACTVGCSFDVVDCHKCGDAIKNGLEQCDGGDFGGLSCADFPSQAGPNFEGGSLSCDSQSCQIATTNCKLCGDGLITADEVCDGSNLAGKTCQTQGFTAGNLSCQASCAAFNTSACTLCGDGSAQGSEQCDKTDLLGQTCQSQGFPNGGTLKCSASCSLDTSSCIGNVCGDGMVQAPDVCDCGNQGSSCTAAQLGNKTCGNFMAPNGQPYTGGTLKCFSPSNCTHDTSACWWCGDGTINGPGEVCDGGALGGQNCMSQGFMSGTLGCKSNCTFDTALCTDISTITSVLNTAQFSNSNLTKPYQEVGRVFIMVPSDVTTMALKVAPNNGSDQLNVQLKDGGTTFASCSVGAGQLCNVGDTINMTGHSGKVVLAELRNNNGSLLGAFTMTVSAPTSGLNLSLAVDAAWRSGIYSADYVIWPVGSATSNPFGYTWTDASPGGVNQTFDIGVISPTGAQYSQSGVVEPNTAMWPKAVPPAGGWYMMGTSTFFIPGVTWHFQVNP